MLDPDNIHKDSQTIASEQSDSSSNKKLQALVIDDDQQIREFVSTVLRDDGWSVAEAETAEHAYEMLNERRWSLVFCDVLLGGDRKTIERMIKRHHINPVKTARATSQTG